MRTPGTKTYCRHCYFQFSLLHHESIYYSSTPFTVWLCSASPQRSRWSIFPSPTDAGLGHMTCYSKRNLSRHAMNKSFTCIYMIQPALLHFCHLSGEGHHATDNCSQNERFDLHQLTCRITESLNLLSLVTEILFVKQWYFSSSSLKRCQARWLSQISCRKWPMSTLSNKWTTSFPSTPFSSPMLCFIGESYWRLLSSKLTPCLESELDKGDDATCYSQRPCVSNVGSQYLGSMVWASQVLGQILNRPWRAWFSRKASKIKFTWIFCPGSIK